jgi:hypothetical protein
MSWFRRAPHVKEQPRLRPHHAVNDDLRREVEENRLRLEQHRQQQHEKETEDGKFH